MKLTRAQAALLAKAPADWAHLPPAVGCTNATLEALEKRGLVETRLLPKDYIPGGHSQWQWRLNDIGERP